MDDTIRIIELVLVAAAALGALWAAWAAHRSAQAAAATAALARKQIEQQRREQEEARRPRVVVDAVLVAPGLDRVARAEARIRNVGGSFAHTVHVRLGDLRQEIEFRGETHGLGAGQAALIPCDRAGSPTGLPPGTGWAGALTWRDADGKQLGDSTQWTAVNYEEPEPPPSRGRARLVP